MDIRKRLFARHASIVTDHDHPVVEAGRLVVNLILFEKVILESICLVEFPTLVRVYGTDGVRQLLSSGAIDIQCEAVVTGLIGQPSLQKPNTLPNLSYRFGLFKANDRKEYVHLCMTKLQWGDVLTSKDIIKVNGAIADRLTKSQEDFGRVSFAQSKNDFLANTPIVKRAVAMVLSAKLKEDIRPHNFSLTLHQVGEDAFRAETDIGARFGMQDIDVHKLVERGLLGVTDLNKRLEEMRRHNALTIFKDGDLPLLDEKLDFLANQMNPEAPRERLRRVMTIAGLPDIERAAEDGKVVIPRLLEIRQSRECREFRDWLASVDSASDHDIEEQMGGLRARLSVLAHSTLGKTVRWLASTALGSVPPVGTVLGAAAGLLDTFLIEKILPQSGPVTFLRKGYPSVFEKDK